MHFRVKFCFDRNVNNEIDMTVWRFLPGASKNGTFFGSGETWFETDRDMTLEDLMSMLKKAIDDVFGYYKKEDMFEYVAGGHQEWLDNRSRMFRLSTFAPPEEIVEKIKSLQQNIKKTEGSLHKMRHDVGKLFRELD